MKRDFGNAAIRLLRGGTRLSSNEHVLLSALVERLPSSLRETVEAQFARYNLVQRERDGRALNFYRVRIGTAKPLSVSPSLPFAEEAPLLRVSAVLGREPEPLHAVLTAVLGRAFCVSFSRAIPPEPVEVQVTSVVNSWKSNSHASATDA